MNKKDLVSVMAEKSGLSAKDTEKALNAFVEAVSEAMEQGQSVQLVGFGTFETRQRAAREGRNPQTKEPVTIPAATVPVFKAGKGLKDRIAK